jgi:hypothetical protein
MISVTRNNKNFIMKSARARKHVIYYTGLFHFLLRIIFLLLHIARDLTINLATGSVSFGST